MTAAGRMPPPPVLQRRLDFWTVTASGVGVIVGAGVYALIGPTAGYAGGAVWLAFLLAAVVAGLTGYSYARFAALRPKNSPEFQYAAMAFGPRVGFTAGWLMLWSDIVAVAAVALAFAGYLNHLVGDVSIVIGATALVVALTTVALWGIAESIGLLLVMTVIQIGGLLIVVAVGLPSWGDVDLLDTPRGLGGVWAAAALIFFAYLGFDELGNLAEETKDPERVLPKALVAAVAISTVLYIAVAVSAVSVAGWEALASSSAPLALVADTALGGRADLVLSLIALAATSSTVLLLLVSASRSLYGMARAGVLPRVLGGVGRRGTPWIASLVAGAVAFGSVLVGDLEAVAEVTNAVILASFLIVNLALFWVLRRRRHDMGLARYTATEAAPPLLAAGLCLLLIVYTGWLGVLAAIALGIAGLLIGGLVRRLIDNESGPSTITV